jgi:Coenzyme PQQ synthesis protein D (PqqD)
MSQALKLAADVEINKVADGYVVYQPDRDRVHYLNHTATIILELCNGSNDAAAIADLLKTAYELPSMPVEEVASCLRQLSDEGLVA